MKFFLGLLFLFLIISMNGQTFSFTQPEYLQQGDTILMVAPAGVVKQPKAILKAKIFFENKGYVVVLGEHLFKKYHHFAGTDANRLQDMQWALNHPTAKAIWCARGGYGSVRIVDDLDFTAFAQKPKWLIGYSDVTVFHNKLHNLGFQSLHAPMPIDFKKVLFNIEESMEVLHNTIQGTLPNYKISMVNFYNKTGTVKGVLVGGNLTILENMIGTDCDITTQNKILFVEEIGEYKYHIDRLLRALDRRGYFKHCTGLIFGDFTNIKQNQPEFGQSVVEMVLAIVEQYNIPVLFDFPAGHDDKNLSLIFGKEATLNITETSATLSY